MRRVSTGPKGLACGWRANAAHGICTTVPRATQSKVATLPASLIRFVSNMSKGTVLPVKAHTHWLLEGKNFLNKQRKSHDFCLYFSSEDFAEVFRK